MNARLGRNDVRTTYLEHFCTTVIGRSIDSSRDDHWGGGGGGGVRYDSIRVRIVVHESSQ